MKSAVKVRDMKDESSRRGPWLRISPKNVPLLATFSVFLLIYLLGGLMYPGFLSLRVFVNLLYDNAFLGIIAVGMTFVILSGGIDLSVGSLVAFSGVFCANLLAAYNIDPVVVLMLTLAIGAVTGLVMGSLIVFFELPPFLVTLVVLFLARGASFMINIDAVPIRDQLFLDISNIAVPLGGGVMLTIHSIVFLVVLLLGMFLLHFTRFGRNVYALGGNEKSALLMGLPVRSTKIMIYTLNSTICMLGGLVYALYTMASYPLAGTGLELDVIASVVIGGTLLAGGRDTSRGRSSACSSWG